MRVYLGATALLMALSTSPLLACMGDQAPANIPLYYQQIDTEHSPDPRNLEIGSVLNLSVPKGSRLSITPLAQGSMDPVVLVSHDDYVGIDPKRLIARDPTPPNDSLDVYHLLVSSFGKVRVDILSGQHAHHLVIGAVYAAKVPSGHPIELAEAGQGQILSFDRSYRDGGIWLKVPGAVTDGWKLQQPDGSDFVILRIEQLEVPYSDPPAVGIFIQGGGLMKSGNYALTQGGILSRKSYPFKVNVRPTPTC